jgi:hypothetical protein
MLLLLLVASRVSQPVPILLATTFLLIVSLDSLPSLYSLPRLSYTANAAIDSTGSSGCHRLWRPVETGPPRSCPPWRQVAVMARLKGGVSIRQSALRMKRVVHSMRTQETFVTPCRAPSRYDRTLLL